eukprot:3027360-Rhodomonas_salina.1
MAQGAGFTAQGSRSLTTLVLLLRCRSASVAPSHRQHSGHVVQSQVFRVQGSGSGVQSSPSPFSLQSSSPLILQQSPFTDSPACPSLPLMPTARVGAARWDVPQCDGQGRGRERDHPQLQDKERRLESHAARVAARRIPSQSLVGRCVPGRLVAFVFVLSVFADLCLWPFLSVSLSGGCVLFLVSGCGGGCACAFVQLCSSVSEVHVLARMCARMHAYLHAYVRVYARNMQVLITWGHGTSIA